MSLRCRLLIVVVALFSCQACWCSAADTDAAPVAWTPSPWFGEQTCSESIDPDVRIYANAPAAAASDDPATQKPTRVILFALPNGNTIEQTLGCKMAPGLDWHYDIQHVAAQVRLLRELLPDERIVLVCAEAGGLSWPTWRGKHEGANEKIGRFVDSWRRRFGAEDAKVTLAGHSGGGGFMFGAVEATGDIPEFIDRIAFLDADYSFDAKKHADKFVRWLKGDQSRRLVVICYDDRNIMLDGKKVVGPDGGTFRATHRMIDALDSNFPVAKSELGPFETYAELDDRIRIFIHTNPENKILHSALVGDMNGLVQALTIGTPAASGWGTFGGPRAYADWIQPEPTATTKTESADSAKPAGGASDAGPRPALDLSDAEFAARMPARPADAVSGSEFCRDVANLSLADRETAIYREITGGNFPEFERKFITLPISAETADGKTVSGTLDVMPDCLAVGSDADFVRMPMRPQSAQRIADKFGCTLPTRKIVDAIDDAATVRLAPQPLTENREAVSAFVLANEKAEHERAGQPLGGLVSGAKKDIVVSMKIFEKPERLAIYGWRQLDGKPIQPLTSVHWNKYVDYSHGVRLVRGTVLVDGERLRIDDLLTDPGRCSLLSDEGPIDPPRYPAD